jgi:hydroxyacylglutathione hydrolase
MGRSPLSSDREIESPRHRFFLVALRVALLFPVCASAWSQNTSGSLAVDWSHGAEHCVAGAQAPLQVHEYNAQTFILREDLCSAFEAPFMYLLVGSSKALLIDTGDVADPKLMPLAQTVLGLLPTSGESRLPLLVVHTHRHLDHRAGDAQFERIPNTQVVGFELSAVQKYFGLSDWPNGSAQIDLGDRTIDVLPTPGHNETHLTFYDRNTGLLFSGDFVMPGRLLIDDTTAELASSKRIAEFAKDRPITHVLGGHIEMNRAGELFPWGSQYHPDERPLQMSKEDLMALPKAAASFNGFYTRHGGFILMNPLRILIVIASAGAIGLIAAIVTLIRYFRRRKARGKQQPQA